MQADNAANVHPVAASGFGSNVVINLTAKQAVALGVFLRSTEKWTADPDAMAAIDKCLAAADRATIPWEERDRALPF